MGRITIGLLALVAISACDSDSPSCELRSGAGELISCVDYAGAVNDAEARASCEGGGGTWSDSSCNTTGAVASCELFGSVTWYYDGYLVDNGVTLADLRVSCEQASGDFTEL